MKRKLYIAIITIQFFALSFFIVLLSDAKRNESYNIEVHEVYTLPTVPPLEAGHGIMYIGNQVEVETITRN